MRKDQNYIKLSNTKMLLDIIKDSRPISRADIAKVAGMSPTSITRMVSFLQQIGLVCETDIYSTGIGRRAVMLNIVADSAFTVGVHIDSTFIELCIINFEYTCIAMQKLPLTQPSYSAQDIALLAYEMYDSILSKKKINRTRILGIGIGVAGTVQYQTGLVSLSPQLLWNNVDIAKIFKEVFHLPVLVENDVKASIVGEKYIHKITDSTDTALLLIGSGVGVAATTGGYLIRGRQNTAGEIGHIVSSPNGILCDCGRIGCLQTYMAEKFLINRAQVFDSTVMTLYDIQSAFDKHTDWAVELMNICLDHFYLALDILTNLYNPAVIIIGGAVTTVFKKPISLAAERFIHTGFKPLISSSTVFIAEAGSCGCVQGSAILAFQKYIYNLLEQSDF
ncbi:MAG: ROK family transcriptional regulator [Clostridiaceae bacterium]